MPLLFALIGLVLGSFGNVLITRLPESEGIGGRSHCPRCKSVLSAHHLIPLLSFVFLRGRCAKCHKTISVLYPAVEAASALLFLSAAIVAPALPQAALLALVLWLLLLIAVVDLRTQMIPDVFNFALIFCAILFALARGSIDPLAIFIGTGFLGAQWLLSRGRWVGSGDILLIFALGFAVPSWSHMAMLLGMAYIIGAVVALGLLLTGNVTRKSHLPFAPFLAAGAAVVLLTDELIMQTLLF